MDKNSRQIEIRSTSTEQEHGLCDAAETHWAIYLMTLINNRSRPQIHEGQTADGKVLQLIKKGEDPNAKGFTFGAESYLVVSSSDPDLQFLLLVEESPDVLVGRPLVSLAESLEVNGFYDSDIVSRWKDTVAAFARNKGVQAKELTLTDLLIQSLKQ